MNTDKITSNQLKALKQSIASGHMLPFHEQLALRIKGMFPDRAIVGITFPELNEKQTTSSSSDTMVKPLIVKTVLPAKESVNNNNNESLSHNVSVQVKGILESVPPPEPIILSIPAPLVEEAVPVNTYEEAINLLPIDVARAMDASDNTISRMILSFLMVNGKSQIICQGPGSKNVWLWNPVTLLWEQGNLDTLAVYFIYNYPQKLANYHEFLRNRIHNPKLWNIIDPKMRKLIDKVSLFSHCYTYAKIISQKAYDKDFFSLLDSKKDLLPIKPGKILNFRTGEIRDRTIDDIFTVECPVAYNPNSVGTKGAEKINDFLNDITLSRKELLKFIQCVLGLCLTGSTHTKQVYFLYGPRSNNGKSTLMKLLCHVMGFFSAWVDKSVFLQAGSKSAGGPSPEKAKLHRKRVGIFSELGARDKFAEPEIKRISGGDPVLARYPYDRDEFEFEPFFKAILLSNRIPKCSSDRGLWNRLVIIPFECEYVDNPTKSYQRPVDLTFRDTIILDQDAMEYFFFWLVQGAFEIYKGPIIIPQCIIDSVNEHREDADICTQYINSRLSFGDIYTQASTLYQDFYWWSKEQGTHISEILDGTEFGTEIKVALDRIGPDLWKRSNKGIQYKVNIN